MPYIERAQNGIGEFGRRVYGRTQTLFVRPDVAAISSLSVYTISGVFVGILRSDVQNTIINQIKFTLDKNGCQNFELQLTEKPPFPILENSKIVFAIDGENYYSGLVDFLDTETTEKKIEYKGFGLREELKKLKVFDPDDLSKSVFLSGTDLQDVIDFIAQNFIIPFCPVSYNSLKIEGPTGTVLVNDIEISKFFIDKVLDTFTDMTGGLYDWGVDGDQDFFFKKRSTQNDKILFHGYDFQNYQKSKDIKNIKNSIVVQRQQSRAEGGAGWTIADVYSDAISIEKYKKRELIYQIPGFFTDSDADIIGNAVLLAKKDPLDIAKLSEFKTNRYLYGNENIKVVGEFKEYEIIFDECSTGFSKSGGGNSSINYDSDIFIDGTKSLRIDYTSAIGDKIHSAQTTKNKVNSILLFIRCNKNDSKIKINFGNDSVDESFEIQIEIADTFIPIKLTPKNLLTSLTYLNFEILENYTGTASFYIDRINVFGKYNEHTEFKFQKADYLFSPQGDELILEIGALQPTMENFLLGLKAQAEELRFTQEII